MIWCDKVQIYCGKQQFKMLAGPIFVEDAKITFVYNFVATLTYSTYKIHLILGAFICITCITDLNLG